MKCPKLKQWYPVTCLKVHLSNMVDPPPEGRVVMNSGINLVLKVVRVFPSHTLPSCQSSTPLSPLMASVIASMKVLELQMFVGEF